MATKKAPPWLKKKTSDPGEDPKEEASETPAQERAEQKSESGPIKRVRDMVAAHSKVPDHKKADYRKACVGAARKAGAMQHIPKSWIKKGD